MKHKRRRAKHQRAGCGCGVKSAKLFGTRNRKHGRPRETNGKAQHLRRAVSADEGMAEANR